MERAITDALMPGAQAALQAGQAVQFGKLSIDGQGITYRAKVLPWSEVSRIVPDDTSYGSHRFAIYSGNRRFAVLPAGLAPNVLLLLELSAQLRAQPR